MLDKIILDKKNEVKINRKKFPLLTFKNKLVPSQRNFKKAISKKRLSLIAEFKKKSPSKNIKNNKFNFKKIIKIYDGHADAISILTNKTFFGGSLNDLTEASRLTKLPLLRKDFIIDEYQIYESRLYNADAILLIASILSEIKLKNFIKIAGDYRMSCIVEINNENDLRKALHAGAEIIGINNRNLATLKIDLNTTLNLADKVPKDKIIISESGISSKEYVNKISKKVDAVLVGSFFMNANKKNFRQRLKFFFLR